MDTKFQVSSPSFKMATARLIVSVLLIAQLAYGLPETRIINGQDAAPGEIPFIVSIQDRLGNHYCGGTIIGPDAILASAFCLNGHKENEGQIVSGITDLTSGLGTVHRADSIILHENYSVNINGKRDNDIAIARVRPAFVFDNFTNVARLPNQDTSMPVGTPMGIAGWGYTVYDGGVMSNTLKRTVVPVVDTGICNEMYQPVGGINEKQICAGGNSRDACTGDDGGPMFIVGDGTDTVHGLVSWGLQCANSYYPGVYTHVSRYRDWIDLNLGRF